MLTVGYVCDSLSQQICNYKVVNLDMLILSKSVNHSSVDFLYCDNVRVKQISLFNHNSSQLQNTT